MENYSAHNHQPEPSEDEERWLDEGGHIAPADEEPLEADTSPDVDDTDTDDDTDQ